MAGIKESKEALVGLNELALCSLDLFKDGLDWSDLGALWSKFQNDPNFSAKLKAAYDGFSAIPEELSDLSLAEMVELAKSQLEYLPKFVAGFKK